MAFAHEWPRPAGGGCWQRGAQRAASVYLPDRRDPAGAVRQRHDAADRIPVDERTMPGLVRLKKRADFLRVAAYRRRAVRPGLLLQTAPQPVVGEIPAVRVGFTASRRVGNAVSRNRAKRRLRAAAALVLTGNGRPGADYVLVARGGTIERPYGELVGDLEQALRQVDRPETPRRAGRKED